MSVSSIHADFEGNSVRLGLARIIGAAEPVQMNGQLPSKPKRLMLNHFGDVLERK